MCTEIVGTPPDVCDHLKEFLAVELKLISEHLDKHAWYNKISDHNEALGDFITRYGGIIRELYCEYICENKNCKCYQKMAHRDYPT